MRPALVRLQRTNLGFEPLDFGIALTHAGGGLLTDFFEVDGMAFLIERSLVGGFDDIISRFLVIKAEQVARVFHLLHQCGLIRVAAKRQDAARDLESECGVRHQGREAKVAENHPGGWITGSFGFDGIAGSQLEQLHAFGRTGQQDFHLEREADGTGCPFDQPAEGIGIPCLMELDILLE